MIKKPTVLILGAGASMPYGFPSGVALTDKLIEMLAKCEGTRTPFTDALDMDPHKLVSIGKNLHQSRLLSIDRYLRIKWDQYPDFGAAAKGIIAAALLPIEAGNLEVIESFDRPGHEVHNAKNPPLRDDWYRILWDYMQEQAEGPKDFINNELIILTFNYDRSLTEYLIQRIKATYDVDNQEAGMLLRKAVTILHVHGSLGIHPALADEETEEDDIIPYGAEVDSTTVAVARKHIRIIYEYESAEDLKEGIRKAISGAATIAFLGLSYHDENLDKLFVKEKDVWKDVQVVGGTTYKMQDGAIAQAIKRFSSISMSLQGRYEQMGCGEYLLQTGILSGHSQQTDWHYYLRKRLHLV